MEGAPLTKQYSSSLFQPSSLLGYENALRCTETGWLDIQINSSHHWERRWFELKDGVIRHSSSPDPGDVESSTFIPIENIIRFVTSNKDKNIIVMRTTKAKMQLRTQTADDFGRWIFAFQKSVVLALLKIRSQGPMSQLVSHEDYTHSLGGRSQWTDERYGGNGHGWQSHMVRTRTTMAGHASALAATRSALGRSLQTDDSLLSLLNRTGGPMDHLLQRTERERSYGDLSHFTSFSRHDEHPIASTENNHGQSQTPHSAPTSPLKMSWGQITGSYPSTPDRSLSALGRGIARNETAGRDEVDDFGNDRDDDDDELLELGMAGDVVLSSLQLAPGVARDVSSGSVSSHGLLDEVEGGSAGSPESNPMGLSYESVGVRATWHSVDDLPPLGSAEDVPASSSSPESPPRRSRTTSDEMSGIFAMDSPEDDSGSDTRRSRSLSSPFQGSVRWLYGSCSRMGPRSSNEDRYVTIPDLFGAVSVEMQEIAAREGSYTPFYGSNRGVRWRELSDPPRTCGRPCSVDDAFFAVYDGHSGAQASTFLQSSLHHSLYTHPQFENNLDAAIFDTCINLDKHFLMRARQDENYSGTTAVGAVINKSGRRLTVFNIGDSQAVMCRGGEAVSMSNSHTPNREDEQARIEAAHGWVTEERELYYGRLHRMDLNDPDVVDAASGIDWTEIYRVCGEISVSRSIGDMPYKGFVPGVEVTELFNWPEGHSRTFLADLVIPDPECITVEIQKDIEFIILASDGLWDVVKRPDAVRRVRDGFCEGKCADIICEELCELAIRLGSSDNVTVVIVQFLHL
eukprot:CAMPEP_0185027176 /NCGR_PEP_ID=MMETSP1103-20130426/11952_1 /TAXON_ID=36769 /ORGANISM="Paraphysomonas bandaiensis, Strain Caron Lab Isolate" /LENGTH=797 /DNA_ID=CAMNT_0027561053 /DNA_START=38 /DNA_END=2431 /DNA_ORIENTATION=-